jgi:NET1-associated nuclear protein 1 (U3 small nucleolar RNA-associated protein 17)
LAGSSVKIHSSTTGDIVSTVSASSGVGTTSADTSHTATITSAILNPENTYQLITGSLDGTIRIWDFLDGALLQTIDVGQPIHRICAHESLAGYVFACVGRISAEGKKKKGKLFRKDTKLIIKVLV